MQEYLRQHAWISQTSCMDITDIMYGYHRRHVWILQTSCMDITNIMYGYLRQHTRISQTSRHVWILQTSCMDISDIMQEYHRWGLRYPYVTSVSVISIQYVCNIHKWRLRYPYMLSEISIHDICDSHTWRLWYSWLFTMCVYFYSFKERGARFALMMLPPVSQILSWINVLFAGLSVRPFVRSSVRPSVCSSVCSFVRPFVRLFVRLFVRSFVRPFVRSFVRQSVRSFVFGEYANLQIYIRIPNFISEMRFATCTNYLEVNSRWPWTFLDQERQRYGVVAASAGNHASALAYHGSLLKVPVTVIMPLTVSTMKRMLCQALGAKVILHGNQLSEVRSQVWHSTFEGWVG